ncbi:MAG TPA: FAD-dependent oxidoreductase [Candidatus Binataceae bacterium]|nr:FAD-dependent oxidoreductase [Candidatus Binataceae bacterium]
MGESRPPESGAKRPGRSVRVERIFDHNGDTRSLFLRMAEGPAVKFVPGQFISISIPLGDETRTRPYTIASSPEDGEPFEICFNRVPGGRGVDYLFERQPGDELLISGPFGLFNVDQPPAAELIFVAIGTGVAPIRPMIRRLLSSGFQPRFHLLYAAHDEAHLLYRGELERWAGEHQSFHLELVTSSAGAAPAAIYDRVYAIVEQRWVNTDTDRTRHFYICGVGPGVLRIRDLLRTSGYERRAVKYEQW